MRALLLLLLALSASWALAQGTPSTYRIQQEDLLRIQLFGPTAISAEVPVGEDGNVSAPFVGTIRAEGKTTAELEAELVQLYEQKLRLREPRVSVTILRFRPVRATVGGMVTRPGSFEVRRGDTLLSLLNLGGGPIPDRADLRRAFLRRKDSRETIPIDLYDMLVRGDMSQNYEVQDGDELVVPEETRNFIAVQGAVQQPGRYPYREPMMLSDAISLAKGEIRYRTRFSRVMVIREKAGMPGQFERIPADYVKFIRQGDQSQNILLQPGDLIYVPETNTPDFNQISALANVAFILDRFGGLLGIRLFGR